MPIALQRGFDRIGFLIMVAVNLQTSFLSPTFGNALFYLKTTVPPKVSLLDIYRGMVPFVVLRLIGLVIICLYPPLAIYWSSVVIR